MGKRRSIYHKGIIGIIMSIFMLFVCSMQASAAQEGKSLLIILDRVALIDLIEANTPNLDRIAQLGAIGLMTTNTAGSRSQRDAYITMGAGTRAVGSDKSHLGLAADEHYDGKSAKEYFLQITGIQILAPAVVNLGLPQTLRNNENRPYKVHIGALGTVLREGDKKAVILGNCDTPGAYKRYLSSLLMDDTGIIPYGMVDERTLTSDLNRPYGLKTNFEALMKGVDLYWDEADFIAIQLGDTSRAEDFRYEATDAMNDLYKKQAIEDADGFIGSILDRADLSKDLILIVTPLGPGREMANNNRLTPIFAIGKGIARGMVISASTRRPGVVTNLDIGATLLGHLYLKPMSGQLGNPIRSHIPAMVMPELYTWNVRLVEIFNQRFFLLRSYVLAQIIAVFFSLAAIITFRKLLWLGKALLYFVMLLPLSYLLLTIFHQSTTVLSFLYAWVGGALIALLLIKRKGSALTRIPGICFVTSLALVVDQWTGGTLIQGSPLGYDVISAARFYGIGNEYMGVLIGAACTAVGAFADCFIPRYRKIGFAAIALFAAAVLYTVAYPGLGANVGGTISTGVAFVVLVLLFRDKKITWQHLIPAGAFLVLLLSSIFFVDSLRALDSRSHMGQTAALIQQNGLGELSGIVSRKLQMNLKLLRYTIWTRVFLAFFVSMIVLLFRPVGILKGVIHKYPMTMKGLAAAVFGSLTALVTNDSGIVAAATAMIYVAPPIIIFVMSELEDRGVEAL